eukprot:scaffold196351_cov30-Tisochrysis_lutea.AAC.3
MLRSSWPATTVTSSGGSAFTMRKECVLVCGSMVCAVGVLLLGPGGRSAREAIFKLSPDLAFGPEVCRRVSVILVKPKRTPRRLVCAIPHIDSPFDALGQARRSADPARPIDSQRKRHHGASTNVHGHVPEVHIAYHRCWSVQDETGRGLQPLTRRYPHVLAREAARRMTTSRLPQRRSPSSGVTVYGFGFAARDICVVSQEAFLGRGWHALGRARHRRHKQLSAKEVLPRARLLA